MGPGALRAPCSLQERLRRVPAPRPQSRCVPLNPLGREAGEVKGPFRVLFLSNQLKISVPKSSFGVAEFGPFSSEARSPCVHAGCSPPRALSDVVLWSRRSKQTLQSGFPQSDRERGEGPGEGPRAWEGSATGQFAVSQFTKALLCQRTDLLTFRKLIYRGTNSLKCVRKFVVTV